MSVVTVGAAQLGPIPRGESRGAVVKRLVAHLHEAKARGRDLVVFDFARHRRPEHYRLIVERTGASPPA